MTDDDLRRIANTRPGYATYPGITPAGDPTWPPLRTEAEVRAERPTLATVRAAMARIRPDEPEISYYVMSTATIRSIAKPAPLVGGNPLLGIRVVADDDLPYGAWRAFNRLGLLVGSSEGHHDHDPVECECELTPADGAGVQSVAPEWPDGTDPDACGEGCVGCKRDRRGEWPDDDELTAIIQRQINILRGAYPVRWSGVPTPELTPDQRPALDRMRAEDEVEPGRFLVEGGPDEALPPCTCRTCVEPEPVTRRWWDPRGWRAAR